ncbi:MAG: YDG domain-containing protein [Flavobacteriia bacterium]|nr:YDG domain-containing protein [Flavobacteriia bacterium]
MKNKLFFKNLNRSFFWCFTILLLNSQVSWGQTYFDMSTSNYTQNFNAITALPTNFSTVAILTTGTIPVATKTTVASTSSLAVVASGTAVGIDATNSTRLVFLTTAGPNTAAIATDLNLNFSNRNAGNLSFDASTIFNSTGDRVGTLRVYYSTDNTNWSELTGTNLPYVATNNVAGSGNISIALPTALNNQSTVKLRFYNYNGTASGTTGSRPKIGIDNLSVTSTAAVASAPSITSILTSTGTVGTLFNYATVASGTPTSYAASGLPSGLSINTSTGVISGTPTAVGSSNVSLSATNATGTDTKTLVITVGQGTQTITFGALAPITYGTTSFSLNGASSSGLQLSYSSSNTAVATISGNTVTIIGAGSTTITASQVGSANFSAATDVLQSLTVNKASQTISFPSLSSKLDTDAPFTLGATSTSSLTVSYSSSNSAVISISGTTATIVGAGNATITASQGGDNNYLAATNSTQNQLVVSTALTNQSITFGTLIPVTYGDGTFNLTATGGESGNPVTYSSSNSTIASISGNIVSIIQPGIVTITASQAGNSSYNVAPSVNQTLTINQKTLTVSNVVVSDKTYDGSLAAIISSDPLNGLVGTDVVSLSNSAVFADANVGSGIAVTPNFTLNGADASKYSLTQPTGLTATISQAAQTITFSALTNKTTADLPFALTASSISGLSITYSSSNAAVATVSGNTVTIVGIGSTTITANQVGNINYNAAPQITQELSVTQGVSVLAGWDFFGQSSPNTFAATTYNSNLNNTASQSTITRGNGAASSSGSNSFRTVGFQNNGISTSNTDFFQVRVTPVTGKTLTLTNINANLIGTASFYATPGVTSQFGYSLNGTNFTLIGSPITSSSLAINFDLSAITELQNIPSGTTVTFRYYASGQTATGGWGFSSPTTGSNGLAITGFTSSIPAPSITSSLTATGTVGTAFTYATEASNSPSSYAATGLPLGLSINTSTGVISGTPTTVGSSNVSLSATKATGTDTKTLELTVGQGTQTITFGALAPITYSAASFSLNGASSSGLPLSYSSSNTAVATISGNTVTIVGAGSTSITASQEGDANYFSASDVSQTLTVNKAGQIITFNSLPNKLDTDVPFTLLATSTSSLAVSFSSSNSAVISISGTTATIVGAGTTTITASQGGDNNYLAATNSTQNQLVISTALTNQSITFGALNPVTYGDGTLNLTATGGESGNPVTYLSSDPTIASISGNVVSIIKPGTVTITASQAGNLSYNTAPSVNQTLTINQKELTVSGATATSRAYDATNIATITGATLVGVVGLDIVNVIGGGTFADAIPEINKTVTPFLTLNGADASKYSLTQPTGLTATISQATQLIMFGALADKTYGDAAFNLFATGGNSGSPIVFTSSDPMVATVLGNTVTIVGVGPVTITASQAGNSNYNPAVDVSQLFTINKANQTITFNALVNRTTADNSFTLGGFASSNLALSYASSNAAVASISGTLVTIVGPGSTTITVSQAGNNLYNPATDVNQTQIVLTAISKWTFEGITTTGSGSNVAVSAEADQGLQTSGTLFSANHSSASTAWSNPAGNGSAKSVSSNNWATGDYWQFKLNASNYHDLSIAFDQTGSGTGPSTFKVQYSTNGTSYTDLSGGTYTLDATGWSTSNYRSAAVRSFDLSSITTLNNKSEVFVRLVNVNTTSNGSGTVATSGTSRIDNFVLTGIACNTSAGITNNTNTNVLTCDAATIALTATGGTSYSWFNGTNVVGTSENLSVTAAGTYTVTVSTDNGCSSSASLVINQNTTTTSSETQTACDSYTWNGTVYTESGVYTYSSTNTSGCTNIATLNLTINTSSTNTTTTSAVGTYTWANNGQTYTSSGVYTGTTINCVTQELNLTIIPLTASLSLQMFLDGYYIYGSNPASMRAARYNNLVASVSANPGVNTDVDVITVELRSAASLNVVAYSVSPILQKNGSVQCTFPVAAYGNSYYVVVKHRSSLPLWSANPITISGSTALSFANNITNAYTNGSIAPMKTLVSGLYASRLGELNDDGFIDAFDYAAFQTDLYSSAYGSLYLLDGDLNGDSYVDASDYAVFDFNSRLGSIEQRPY